MASAVASYVDAEAASAAVVTVSLVDSRSANGPKWGAVRRRRLRVVEEQQDYAEESAAFMRLLSTSADDKSPDA